MIRKQSIKKCKGTGKASGFNSCGEVKVIHRYGLCKDCFTDWLFSTPEGKETLNKSRITGKNKAIKAQKKADRQRKRDLNTSGAMNLADMYFSRYIRLRHSKDGYCTCYTCGKILPIKELDNGHYQKRQYKATRYHENNCRPQCKVCNGDTKYNGKQVEFRINLINEIGLRDVLNIESFAKTTVKMSAKDYRDIADNYREKVNTIQKEMKVKYW